MSLLAAGCDINGACDISTIGWPGALVCIVFVVAAAVVAVAFFRSL